MVAGTSPAVKVAMALRNNTTTDRVAFLMRYADIDANRGFINSLGATSNSAFGWDPTAVPNIGLRGNFGINLVADALPQQHSPDLGPQGFTQSTPAGPAPCNPYAQMFAGLQTAADGSVVAIYELGVPTKASKSVVTSPTLSVPASDQCSRGTRPAPRRRPAPRWRRVPT